jgi:steroid delta-isomerase-like uncharacterized protein
VERRRKRRKGRLAAAWSLAVATAVGVAAWLRARERSGGSVSMSEANKTIARRVIEEIYGQGRLDTADELIADDAISHDAALPEPLRGIQGIRDAAAGYRAGFPDLHLRIEEQCSEGELVCSRWTATGTHTGDFWGLAPTGKEATVTGMTMDRIAGGKIVESWTSWDALGLMQQLGAVPAAAPA